MGIIKIKIERRKQTLTSINNSTKWSALSCYSSCQRSCSAVCSGSGGGCSVRNNNLKLSYLLQKTLMQTRKKPPRASVLTTSLCGYSENQFLRKSNYNNP